MSRSELIVRFCFLLVTGILVTSSINANIYQVTTNSDAGTGSLRQAINDANVHAGADSIYFSIGDTTVSGRSIHLLTSLPSLTDEVTIDAITQVNGHRFGVSFAKILITTSQSISSAFTIEADSCELYGFFIYGFEFGISVFDSYSKIGAIAKGNVIFDCVTAKIKVQGTDHVAIQGNLIGLDTAGNVLATPQGDGIYVTNSFAISIGGKTFLAYNIISGNSNGIHLDNVTYVDINSNNIGTNIAGLEPRPNQYGIYTTGLNTNIEVGGDSLFERNIISGNLLSGINGQFASSRIQGNTIGLDNAGLPLANGGEGIYLSFGSVDNKIGGQNLSEPNTIARNTLEGVVLQSVTCMHNTITRNHMFCNGHSGGILLNSGNEGILPPELLIVTSTGVGGVTVPNGIVELFVDNFCVTCEGSNFIAAVSASSTGTFGYQGTINGKITATVTDTAGNTSAFATCVDTTSEVCLIGGFTTTSPLCETLSVNFADQSVTNPSSTLTNWEWYFGDGGTSTQQSPSHVYSADGPYFVTLIVTNSFGCTDTVLKTIAIGQQPTAQWAVLEGACVDQVVSFTDQSSAGANGTITNWFWEFGDTATSLSQNPNHTYASTGTYSVQLTVTNNYGCIDSTTGIVTVFPQPVASFNYIENNLQVTFTNTSVDNGSNSVIWDFGDGMISNQDNPIHTYTSGGIYTVCLTVFDSTCMNDDSSCLTIDVTVGIDDPLTNSIFIAPNPASDFITISTNGEEIESIRLFNVLGQKVLNFSDEKYLNSKIELPIKEIEEGIYFLKLETGNGVVTKKVVVRR